MTPADPPAGRGAAGFRGWYIVAVAFAAQAFAIGFTILPYGLFVPAVAREFGASTALVQSGYAAFNAAMTLAGPIVGPILDRRSIRAVMAGGALLLSGSLLAISLADRLWQLGLLFGVGCALGVAMLGPLSATTVVAKWFDRRRGQAVGLAAMGPPAGGLLLMPPAGFLIEEIGWRAALRVFAAVNLAIVPFVWWAIRNRPEDVGQLPDGGPAAQSSAGDGSPAAGGGPAGAGGAPPGGGEYGSTAALLRSRNFWALALGAGIVFGFGGGWNANAPQFGVDLGHGLARMAAVMGFAAGLGIPATPIFGALADRFDNRKLLWLSIAVQIGALLWLRSEPGWTGLVAGFFVFGFSAGGMLPVYASLIGRLFGPLAFGRVMGLAGLVMLPFASAAPVAAGALRDSSGDYRSALALVALAFAGGAALLGLVRQPPRAR